MKVVAFNGSPRKDGNTSILINYALGKLSENGIECELVQLCGSPVRGCMACMKCGENQNKKCVIENDVINECIGKMIEADGIIIGSPTYFANLTTETKALIDRSGYVTRSNGMLLKRKVGAAVVAVRRAGAINVFNSINDFFLINEMIVPGSSYWNMGIGRAIGEVENDAEGIKTMETLGENMAWLLNKVNG
ncbi:MAG: flavodoxin family protein [Candidatus Margulisiibacteriota bacterium]|nr:MAG: FMN reductase [Candidatus Margulisbacteria bacterium GWD2_39_127]OGI04732.1 MAG: FMN reductase [Candidatus Margulisbacteria bacterium GWF2_38_17]OGI05677.1 MAG: FMN reductase [Candidatus Margulisbacteria bacterium GWE2_39_32]PZM83611.1 MAG: flavodoxin family protein [Candidatus Margulisiibacteriota bacterium]HAR62029.1 flavodoxin family protein [Candidatus Margulisiibacteriota bacterium]